MPKRKTILKDPLIDPGSLTILADEPTVASGDTGAIRSFLNQGLESLTTMKETATRSARRRFLRRVVDTVTSRESRPDLSRGSPVLRDVWPLRTGRPLHQ